MKIYLYNCNNKNEYLGEVQTDTPEQWEGCYTEQPYRQSHMTGASYAWNPERNDWDIFIEDWRGVTLYNKVNSLISKAGEVGPLPDNYVPLEPPNNYERFIWNEEEHDWTYYKEMVNIASKLQEYEDSIQQHIDRVAQERGYDNGYTCASYYKDKDPQYALDAKVFKDWRSDVWVYVNNILNQFSSGVEGVTEIPAYELSNFPSIYQIIHNLPIIQWEEAVITQGE